MSDQIMQSQVAVVTGGSRGIGTAIATRLARLGATTIITGRSLTSMENVCNSIISTGGRCEAVECDLTRLADVERLANHVQRKFGSLDVLVNNAGVGAFATPLHQLPPEEWDQVLNTNLRAVFYTIRAFAPMMIQARSGHIINISSIASKNAVPNAAAYCASKWGLNGLSYTVAEELRTYNIRVSVICPGSTATSMLHQSGRDFGKMQA